METGDYEFPGANAGEWVGMLAACAEFKIHS